MGPNEFCPHRVCQVIFSRPLVGSARTRLHLLGAGCVCCPSGSSAAGVCSWRTTTTNPQTCTYPTPPAPQHRLTFLLNSAVVILSPCALASDAAVNVTESSIQTVGSQRVHVHPTFVSDRPSLLGHSLTVTPSVRTKILSGQLTLSGTTSCAYRRWPAMTLGRSQSVLMAPSSGFGRL